MFALLKQTFREWQEDRAPMLAAALAYYTVFSLAPLLVIVIALVGLLLGQGSARQDILAQFQTLFGPQVAEFVGTMLENRSVAQGGVVATIVGAALLLLGASGVFIQLQNALNEIWDVAPAAQRGGLAAVLKKRLLAFGMILVVGFLLLVSLVIPAAISVLERALGERFPGSGTLWQWLAFALSLAVIVLLFAMIFRFLPDVEIMWRDVWIGAAVTALLFTVGKTLIGLYLGNSGVASAYGAAGALVLLLLWIFYSAQIVLLGGEFTQVYAKRRGGGVEPAGHAVRQG
jgi:membrane protein